MITIIDYNAGNLNSVYRAIQKCGFDATITNDPHVIEKAKVIVFPGQGAFKSAKVALDEKGLAPIIQNHIRSEKPFLGICLGLQILFEKSYEHGEEEGWGIFKGEVKPFKPSPLKVPHMGWNNITIKQDKGHYFAGVPANTYVYFVHSFYVDTPDKDIITTTTTYGTEFVSAVQKGTLLATQFHLEKSSDVGLSILKNYLTQHS